MFQIIGEKISVAGVYSQAHFTPRKFLWNNRQYHVSEVTLVSDLREGGTKKRMYSLVCGTTLYRVMFNRDSEDWTLEELWVE